MNTYYFRENYYALLLSILKRKSAKESLVAMKVYGYRKIDQEK